MVRGAATLAAWVVGCTPVVETAEPPAEVAPVAAAEPAERAELDELRTKIGIPAMSAALVRNGRVEWKHHLGDAKPGDAYPIASITKTMAGIVAVSLVAEGKLDLDRPATAYATALKLPKDVTVRHLLTHTSVGSPAGKSVGRPGETFSYNGSRFGKLGAVLEAAGGGPLAEQLQARIFAPAAMSRTTVDADLDAASGVNATLGDMALYAARVTDGMLLPKGEATELFVPAKTSRGTTLPYGLGWFVADMDGEPVVWHYGQLPDASSLLVIAPRQQAAFVVLARSDLASAPFALLLGNLRWSPFGELALGWLGVRVDPHHTDALVGRALMAGVRDRAAMERRLVRLLDANPEIAETPDARMLHVLARTESPKLRDAAEAIGKLLLRQRDVDPRFRLDLAVLRLRSKRPAKGVRLLEDVVALEGHPVLVVVASFVLGEYLLPSDPERARPHLERVVAMDVDPRITAQARALLESPRTPAGATNEADGR